MHLTFLLEMLVTSTLVHALPSTNKIDSSESVVAVVIAHSKRGLFTVLFFPPTFWQKHSLIEIVLITGTTLNLVTKQILSSKRRNSPEIHHFPTTFT